MIIDVFLETLHKKKNKDAFIYFIKDKLVKKTYGDVNSDLYKFINFAATMEITNKSRVLFFLKPSYDFYIAMIGCLYLGIPIIIIDDYKDQSKLKKMIELANPTVIFTNKVSDKIVTLFKTFKNIPHIIVGQYQMYEELIKYYQVDNDKTSLITFTSGTTGAPKMVTRNIAELTNQFQLIGKTIGNIETNDIVLALLPIYVLVNMIFGVTSVLSNSNVNRKRNVKKMERLINTVGVNSVSASPSIFLAFKKTFTQITKAYTGGALIAYNDALLMKRHFPNAYFTYVYGASEAVLISHTTLEEYIKNLEKGKISLGNIVPGINIRVNGNDEGIGEIEVSGEAVLMDDYCYHKTGDVGYILDDILILKGRSKFSQVNEKPYLYNYDVEMKILNDNPKVKKVVFFGNTNPPLTIISPKCGNLKLDAIDSNVKIIKINKIPVDSRHKYKIDFIKIQDIINKNLNKRL